MTDIALPGLPLAVEPHRRPTGPRTAVAFSERFIDSARQRVQDGKPLRRSIKPWGRVHIDRPLPFLVVYRQPIDRDDFGTELLIVGEASYLLAPGDRRLQGRIAALLEAIAAVQSKSFGAFLILEVWSQQDTAERPLVDGQSEPGFRITRPLGEKLASTVSVLADSLEEIRIKGELASVEIESAKGIHPPGLKPLLSAEALEAVGAHVLGLEVRPIYRKADMSESYPLVHRTLHKGLSKALKRTVFEYTRRRTSHRPANYQALGRRAMVKAVWDVDRRLAKVSNAFDLILQVTPTNTDAAWSAFRKHRFERPPEFTSRPLKLDTSIVKRELYRIPIERVEDPLLAQLFRDQQLSLDRRLTLLGDRGSPHFLLGSLQVFGGADEPLLTLAHDILDHIPSRSRDESTRGAINATEFAARANEEIEYYRSIHSDVRGGVDVRDDIAGAMVSRGRLLVGAQMKVPASRVDALIAHEVGTHIVTFVNGQAQPFRQLSFGLPGYDELQEGMAVLAEYLVGGFSRPRLRLLAARVLAVHRMVQGGEFTDVFRELDRAHDFAQRTAFNITMRVFRGGGLTKDVVYLRGLVGVLDYLREGGSLEPLLVGKLGPDHVAIIEELRWRKVLVPPPLRPRYLDNPIATRRLDGLRRGVSVLELRYGGSHMKIGLVVNDIKTEESGYTTSRLAMAAINRGHEAWVIGTGDFAYDADETVHAHAISAPKAVYKSSDTYIADLTGRKAKRERINVDELDVLMLRNDPSTDTGNRAWAQSSGIIFGRVAMRRGLIVVNDPNGLAKAMNKMYFQLYPEEVRPRTIITRDRQEIRDFWREQGGTIVLKPLQGSGGQGVFLVREGDGSNLNQMVDAVSRDGFVIAQEYLTAAEEGDTRLFLMNGQPLRYRGKYAAFRRVRSGEDMRSNIHAGGKLREAVITDQHLRIAEIVRPKVVQDGMFLVGLDIVGDKLMEINVFSPGGLGSAQRFEKVNFNHAVIEALERKVDYMKYYQRNFDNVDMATL